LLGKEHMMLSVDEEDVKLLRMVLQAWHADLIAGIDHADTRTFRAVLREQAERLERIQQRLDAPVREPADFPEPT
jgi:hypothetical protein